MKTPLSKKIILGNVVGVLILVYVFFQGYKTINQFQFDAGKVNETHLVLTKAHEIFTLSLKIQNSARGYVIRPDEHFKKEITAITAKIYSELGSISEIEKNNSRKQKIIDSLTSLIDQRLTHTNNLIDLVKINATKDAIELVQSGVGDILADKTNSLIVEMQKEDLALLSLREKESRQSKNTFFSVVGFGILILLIIYGFLLWQVIIYRRRAFDFQQKLTQRKNFLNDILNYNNAHIYIKDLQGRYLLINNSIEKLLNISKDFMEGKTDHELFPAERADENRNTDLMMIQKKEKMEIEEKIQLQDGMHYFRTTKFPIYDERGYLYAIGSNSVDITEQKNYLKALEDSKMQLEIVNQELESFSYSVSHDLRAPLRSIGGFTDILKTDYTDKLDDEAKRLMRIITDNTEKMKLLIDGLLSFSKLGQKAVIKTEVDNKAIVDQIVTDVKHRNPGRKIKWTINQLPVLMGDLKMIRQVWENYISNAVKYSRNEAMTEIEIGAEKSDTETIFYVKDNGAGFNMDYSDKLFTVFQRLHSTDEFEGTGIGLATVKKIVEKHGGGVWAIGKEGIGSCFYFSLPSLS